MSFCTRWSKAGREPGCRWTCFRARGDASLFEPMRHLADGVNLKEGLPHDFRPDIDRSQDLPRAGLCKGYTATGPPDSPYVGEWRHCRRPFGRVSVACSRRRPGMPRLCRRPTTKILVDETIPRMTVERLRELGHDVRGSAGRRSRDWKTLASAP